MVLPWRTTHLASMILARLNIGAGNTSGRSIHWTQAARIYRETRPIARLPGASSPSCRLRSIDMQVAELKPDTETTNFTGGFCAYVNAQWRGEEDFGSRRLVYALE